MNHFLPPQLKVLERTYSPNVDLLLKLNRVMWDAPGAERMIELINRSRLEAYSTGEGLILIETVDWMRGRELSLYGIVGRGILKRGEAIMEDLKAIAHHKCCSMIGGTGIPAGWKRYAPRLGFEPVSTHYVMETY